MSGITPTSSSATDTSKLANPSSSLGKDDFLRLLVAQLRYQDPMNPVEDKDFMGTMAQLSMDGMRFSNQVSQSVSLIGRTVTYEDADGNEASGVVDSVAMADGTITVKVGPVELTPDAIKRVA